jgi:hypothetical protein
VLCCHVCQLDAALVDLTDGGYEITVGETGHPRDEQVTDSVAPPHNACGVAFSREGNKNLSQQSGTAAEAKAMFDRAVAALKADKATALSEFNDKNNKQFHDRDLYVFCFNMSDGKLAADADQAVMGIDIRTLKFKDDPFGQRQYDATKSRTGR